MCLCECAHACSRPVTVGSTKPVFQALAAFLALYFLYCTITDTLELAANGAFRPPPRAVRLTVLGLRDPTAPAAAVNPLAFGLLRDGCPVPPVANASNGTAALAFREPVAVNGYYLRIATGRGLAGRDPVRWTVEAQSDASGARQLVGASVWRGQGTMASFYPYLAYPTPLADSGDVLVKVDGRAGWTWMLDEIVTYLVGGGGWSLYAWCGLTGRQRAATMALRWLFTTNTVQLAAVAAGYGNSGNWRGSAGAALDAVGNLIMATALWWDEALIIRAILAFCTVDLLAAVRNASLSRARRPPTTKRTSKRCRRLRLSRHP